VVIKTAWWFSNLPADPQMIGISRGIPRRMSPGYRVFRKLAPGNGSTQPASRSIASATIARSSRYSIRALSRIT
jgi:hypothetical protein